MNLLAQTSKLYLCADYFCTQGIANHMQIDPRIGDSSRREHARQVAIGLVAIPAILISGLCIAIYDLSRGEGKEFLITIRSTIIILIIDLFVITLGSAVGICATKEFHQTATKVLVVTVQNLTFFLFGDKKKPDDPSGLSSSTSRETRTTDSVSGSTSIIGQQGRKAPTSGASSIAIPHQRSQSVPSSPAQAHRKLWLKAHKQRREASLLDQEEIAMNSATLSMVRIQRKARATAARSHTNSPMVRGRQISTENSEPTWEAALPADDESDDHATSQTHFQKRATSRAYSSDRN